MAKRAKLSTRDRLRTFEANDGICHLCGLRINAGERWEVSHPIPLELGGLDNDTNRAPAHERCHAARTRAVDIPAIAKSKRVRARHIGAFRSHHPMPCGRSSRHKKPIGSFGTVPRVSQIARTRAYLATLPVRRGREREG